MTSNRQKFVDALNDESDSAAVRIPTSEQTFGAINVPSIPRRNQIAPEILQKSLIRGDDGALHYKQFKLTPTALIFPEMELSQEDWVDLGIILTNLERSTQWWVGDWANRAHDVWGMGYELIASEFSYEIETLYTYAWVARQIDFSIRNRELSFSHHRLVAGMESPVREEWLQVAVENQWTLKQFKKAIAEANGQTSDERGDMMASFTKHYTLFAKKQLAFAQQATPAERQHIADLLDALARQIRALT
jgi:hypothetical protein